MSADRTRVLVVEPIAAAASRIAAVVEAERDFTLAGRVADYTRAWSSLPAAKPHIIVCSTRSDDTGAAVSFLRHLRYADLPVECVMIVSSIDFAVARRLRRLGVAQCLVAPVSHGRLRQAMHAVARQQSETSSPSLRQTDLDRLWNDVSTMQNASADKPSRLVELRELVTAGGEPMSAVRAARLLGVSRVTARRHLETLVSMGEVETDSVGDYAGRPTKIYQIKDVIDTGTRKVS